MSQMNSHGRSVRLARSSNDFGISMKPILQKVKYFLGGSALRRQLQELLPNDTIWLANIDRNLISSGQTPGKSAKQRNDNYVPHKLSLILSLCRSRGRVRLYRECSFDEMTMNAAFVADEGNCD